MAACGDIAQTLAAQNIVLPVKRGAGAVACSSREIMSTRQALHKMGRY